MGENEDVKTDSSRVMEIVNQMQIYGEDITDARIVQKILVTLTKKYDMIVTVIEEERDLSKLTVTELLGSLLAHDQKFKNQETSSEDAFQSMHKQKGSDSKGWKRKEDSTSRKTFPPCGTCGKTKNAEKNSDSKGKIQCHHCKKFGHIEKNCRQKQMESKAEAHYSSSNQNEHLFYARQATTSNKICRWLIDSGCTNHMTNDSSLFCKLDTSVQTPVRMGNGEVLTSKGKGTIVVPTKKGRRFINDVLLVPVLSLQSKCSW